MNYEGPIAQLYITCYLNYVYDKLEELSTGIRKMKCPRNLL